MGKVLFALILLILGMFCGVKSPALSDQAETSDSENQKTANLVPNFKLDFDNISELSKNNALSEMSQKLMTTCLQLIRGLVDNKDATGTDSDLQSAQGYMAQLMTLKDRLKDTDSSEKINKVSELHETGKEEVEKNKKIVEQLPLADSLTKVIELPGLNKDTVERIKAYNDIINSIAAVKTAEDVYKIPGMPNEFIEQSKKDYALLEQMKKIDSIKLLKEFPIVSPKLVEEIEQLEKLPIYIKEHCETIDGILKIPNLPEKGIVAIKRLQSNFEAAKEQIEKLQKELKDVSAKFEEAARVTRSEYHFRMILISILSRALYGFEFTLADNFEEVSNDYDNSIVAHCNSWMPSSGGVDKPSWKATAGLLGGMLQLVLSVEDVSKHIPMLKRAIKQSQNNLRTSNSESSRFILDSLNQMLNILVKYEKDRNLKFEDFDERKKLIIEKIERMNRKATEKAQADRAKPKTAEKRSEKKEQTKTDTAKTEQKGQVKVDKTHKSGKKEQLKTEKSGKAEKQSKKQQIRAKKSSLSKEEKKK